MVSVFLNRNTNINKDRLSLQLQFYNNGQEDLEYRLLHVYYSPKRAGNQGKRIGTTSMYEMKTKRQKPSTVKLESPFSMSSISTSTALPHHSPFVLPALSKDSIKEVDIDYMSNSFFAQPFAPLRNEHILPSFSKSWDEEYVENHKHFSYENNTSNFRPHLTPIQVSKEEDYSSYSPNKILSSISDCSSGTIRQEPSDSTPTDIHPSLIDFKTCWLEPIPLGESINVNKELTTVSCI